MCTPLHIFSVTHIDTWELSSITAGHWAAPLEQLRVKWLAYWQLVMVVLGREECFSLHLPLQISTASLWTLTWFVLTRVFAFLTQTVRGFQLMLPTVKAGVADIRARSFWLSPVVFEVSGRSIRKQTRSWCSEIKMYGKKSPKSPC